MNREIEIKRKSKRRFEKLETRIARNPNPSTKERFAGQTRHVRERSDWIVKFDGMRSDGERERERDGQTDRHRHRAGV